MNKGYISLKGDVGRDPAIAKTVVNGATAKAAVATFATYLKTSVTDCTLNYHSFVDRTDDNEAAPGTSVDVDVLAIFVVKEDAGTIHKYAIPGPQAAIIEVTQNGRRILAATQITFAAALSTLTGLTFTPLQGYIIEKK